MRSRWQLVAIAAVLSSCSHSILIRSDDATYRRAIEHYQRTRRLVTESLAPDDDQAMFLQAESMFRYRFDEPSRSAGSYLALVGAAVISLPVLESLAGSLDLYTLRIRSYDGAIQLWETLLARNATTPLRPLVLYRLGWAYRNAIAAGFPRSSDLAFDEIASHFANAPVAPFAAAAKKVEWKSQARATWWSIAPGLGQMYVGHYASGVARLTVALISAAMVIVPAVVAYERRDDLSWHSDWPLLVTATAGATIVAFDYSSSYDDAMRAVLEYNEQREAEFDRLHPDAP